MFSGRAMCRHLVSLGISAQKIIHVQATGEYIAEFFVPEMSEPVAPAATWAKRILEVLPQARIVDTHDTCAVWRPHQPVIYCTVIFQIPEESEDTDA